MNRISIFPLPSSVFFPDTPLPLHIFEPRYRDMVEDSIKSNQWIGMVLLKPGWENEYYNKPEVQPIGCAGNLEKWNRLNDGKFDIVLKGQKRFKIINEFGDTSYRQAEVEWLNPVNDQPLEPHNTLLNSLMGTFRQFIDSLPEKNSQKVKPDLSDCKTLSQAVDRISYLFDMSLDQKKFFLEEIDVLKRHEFLMEYLRLKIKLVFQSKKFKETNFDYRRN